ncbi:MAG TPA: citrate/2-methylcitrate synthase [Candidatus Acidoferrales bacterium]|nr:citrate/2-methylcitrate synthase [Candidatus Acidoferrales bacterium]
MNAVNEPVVIHKGLDNVYVKESKICYIDGEASKLFYRGFSIEELASHSTFEETTYLLIYGWLPTRQQLDQIETHLGSHRSLEPKIIDLLRMPYAKSDAMDVLRTAVSALGVYDPQPMTDNITVRIEKSLTILAKVPTIIAAFHRLRSGNDPIPPKGNLSHAAEFLYMLTGREPGPYDAHVMDVALILHAEHEMNASTFACTVTASTLADMYSVITSGIGTLRGPLHGGANEAALKMVLEVGDASNAENYVADALAHKQRIMGFGHRVYKTWDPRYLILKKLAGELAVRKGQTKLFDTAVAIETSARKHLEGTPIFPNVDSYSGIVFHMLGIETDLFTPIFAMSRISGWTAHAIEYLEANRLIRPKALYVGKIGLPYTPIDQRTGKPQE